MPRQLSCHGMCKIATSFDHYFLFSSNTFIQVVDEELKNISEMGPRSWSSAGGHNETGSFP